jgi:hypothetical protein
VLARARPVVDYPTNQQQRMVRWDATKEEIV